MAVPSNPFKGIFPYLVSHLIGAGVHGLSPLGSTCELAYLSFEQRCELVRIVVDETAGRVPVVPGVAAYATHDARWRRSLEA